MPLTPARTVPDWRRRLDRLGARTMTAVGDWLAPRARAAPSEPRISALVAAVAVAGGVLPILVMAVTWATRPEPARPEPPCRAPRQPAGYVLADRPGEDRYRPGRQCNSAGAENTVERSGTGRYLVVLGRLGRAGGVAEVTAVTRDDRICTLLDWHPDGADELLRVNCFDRAGKPADSGFTARWHLGAGAGAAAYLRLGDPGRTSQTVDDEYSHNGRGGTNSADREDTGSYVVHFGSMDDVDGGTVKVTPVADAATVCEVQRWFAYPEGRNLAVRVRCRDVTGQPVDSRFAITFAAGPDAVHGGYLRADRPGEARYTPRGPFQLNRAGQASVVTRTGRGQYRVGLGGLPGTGDLQVTPYDTAASCVIGPDDDAVHVICHAPSGARADAGFLLIARR
ncbi:hypothetical protein [Actinoplanes teichomyceticus]|nr:hypothetical protein [Actinoplanes teichomyceticus]GIF14489.1 hypothetical protein Ate01nite_45210 [Actinoplanes teichomyceticus]